MSGCFLTAPLFWRRLSGTLQVSKLCSRGVWSLLHCSGGVYERNPWGRRATAARLPLCSSQTHCPSLQGAHPDSSSGVWNSLKLQCLAQRDMKYSQPTSLQTWTRICSWWCSSVWKMLLTMVRNSPHLPGTFSSSPTQGTSPTFSFSFCMLGFNPTPANQHACNCRV